MTYGNIHKTSLSYFSWYFVFILVTFSALPLAAGAQETSSIKIQPAIIEERVDPGQVFSSTLSITNLADEARTFYILKRDIRGLSSIGTPIFADEEEKTGFEISSWIKVVQELVTIPAGKTREIPFSITVPLNASPGGHFGGIFTTLTPSRPKETGVAVGFQVGTIINLRISGEVFEEAQIREFRTDRTIYGKPEVKFIARLENIGNVLVRPRGPLDITDFSGKKVATLRVNDEGAGVFPKTIRDFEAEWQGEGLAFGRYQAVMSLVYGEEERKTISDTLSFWVLPLNVILPVSGGLIAFIVGAVIFVKLYIRGKLRQLQRTASGSAAGAQLEGAQKSLRHFDKHPLFFSKLTLIAIAALVLALIFLITIFFLFA